MRAASERLGLFFAVACAINGAFVPAVAKLTTGRADALLVAALSNACAGLAALLVLGLRRQLAPLVAPRLAPSLVLIATLGTALAHYCFYLGASRTSAIVATLCLQVEPAYALLLSWLVLGHRPTPRRLAATALLLGGIALALGASAFETSTGVWLLLFTPLCWQVSHLVVLRRLVGTPAVVLSGARYLYGGAMLLALWAVGGAASPPAAELTSLLPLLAVQGTVLGLGGTLLWYEAIARLDLTRATAIVVPLIPLLSLAASFALLGEVATPRQWLGLGLTAFGILLFVTGPAAVEREA
jgi:drug/metabolite transporter (DMT)-like permease